jgi:hypothetical protein
LGGFAPLSSAAVFLGNGIESISANLSNIENVCPSASSPNCTLRPPPSCLRILR